MGEDRVSLIRKDRDEMPGENLKVLDISMRYHTKCTCVEEASTELASRDGKWARYGGAQQFVPRSAMRSANPGDVARFYVERLKEYRDGAIDGALEVACICKYILRKEVCDDEKLEYNIPVFNRYSIFYKGEFEELVGIDEHEISVLQDYFRTNTRPSSGRKTAKTGRIGATGLAPTKGKAPSKKPKETVPPMSEEERKQRVAKRKAAIRRIKEKLAKTANSYGLLPASGFFLQQPSSSIVNQMMEKTCTASARALDAYSSSLLDWLLYCRRVGLSKKRALWGTLHYIIADVDLSALPDSCWVRCLVDDGDVESNPGPICKSMDDVRSALPSGVVPKKKKKRINPSILESFSRD